MTQRVTATHSVIRRWPTAESQRWLQDFLKAIETDENVRALIAVGSSIRPGVESEDLDLIVICRDRKLFSYKTPMEIDLRTFSEAGLDDEISRANDLLCWAVKFGVAIFDRGAWRGAVERWSKTLPFPNARMIRERALKVRGYLSSVEEMGDEVAADELRLSELTLRARAVLVEANVYPASRPELPGQLLEIGQHELARQLAVAMRKRNR